MRHVDDTAPCGLGRTPVTFGDIAAGISAANGIATRLLDSDHAGTGSITIDCYASRPRGLGDGQSADRLRLRRQCGRRQQADCHAKAQQGA
ncbi:hypothetical protein SDC9_57761 [bioreactor metagenome]|uniref:Uncharacterized protein n=1 Tax=bioreactor metagenome TaxID=1076179 RepID=A0A644X642_9ZZZZ